MARRLRILFGALTLPYPLTNGHRLRTWALVRALAEDGHPVTLVSLAEPSELHGACPDALREVCRAVQMVPFPRASVRSTGEAVGRLRSLASPLPYGAWKFRSAEFTAAVRQHLIEQQFDLILCDGIYNVLNLPRDHSVPVLLNKDDVNYVIFERWARLERNPLRRCYGLLERSKVRRLEASACRRVTGILACSEVDRALLRSLCPQVPSYLIPNVVDTDHYQPRPNEETDRPIILYQGGMDWRPNRDAVEFFVAAILPELRRLVRSVVFRVAGRSPSEAFRRRFTGVAGVEFAGTVSDMRDETARATVCVVPLRIGSGTRLKILEAAAMAKPIVSTSLGAEGLEFAENEEILLADSPRHFAEHVAALLRDEGRRAQLGRAARLRVEKQYSFPVLQATLRQALAGVGL